ncbi:MAG: hypothetical protein JWP25_4639 [Bradyrhizobium sp.]|nr:hypothetical protein [Bradyrhizobium sp.]
MQLEKRVLTRTTPEYKNWCGMRARCLCPTNADYANYGGRGITICPTWEDFQTFLRDMGPRPSPKHSLDRRDNAGNYEPANCRWAVPVEQSNNRRSNRIVVWNGIPQTLAELVRAQGASYTRTMNRLRRGWTLEAAVKTPPDVNKINIGLRS